MTNYKLFNALV